MSLRNKLNYVRSILTFRLGGFPNYAWNEFTHDGQNQLTDVYDKLVQLKNWFVHGQYCFGTGEDDFVHKQDICLLPW